MWPRASLLVLAFVLLVIACVAPPVQKKKAEEKAEKDPEYARYLKQVIEILEEDDEYVQKLMNATEDELRDGQIADDIEFVKHGVRMKLDELKRQEIERQRMIRRQMNDHLNGIKERETWNPLFDDDNPNFFGAEDFKKLLNKHHEEMDRQNTERRKDFKEHELEKDHERREKLKKMDEEARKKEEERYREHQEKISNATKNLHHPGSKAQLEEVWEESDGLDKEDFNPKTFFNLHDVNGDGFLDLGELEALFVTEVDKIYDNKDKDYDPKERDEEIARMREHVMSEIDKDKDGFVSQQEFLKASGGEDFEKDEGWKNGINDEKPYTDEEMAEYEKSLDEEEKKRVEKEAEDQKGIHHEVDKQTEHDQQQQTQEHAQKEEDKPKEQQEHH